MKYAAIVLLAVSLGCDVSSSSGPKDVGGLQWKQIPCPSYAFSSGLYRIDDPDNGNTIYIHLGKAESSIFVVPPQKTKVGP